MVRDGVGGSLRPNVHSLPPPWAVSSRPWKSHPGPSGSSPAPNRRSEMAKTSWNSPWDRIPEISPDWCSAAIFPPGT